MLNTTHAKLNKRHFPLVADFNLDINLKRLQEETDSLAKNFVDVETANPMLCNNHATLVQSVYDNFTQINLTTPSEMLPHTLSVKERLKRKEEHLYNVPTADYIGSVFEEIVNQFKAPAIRIRITKLEPGKEIPFHVDYDINYAVRCICPVYTNKSVINQFVRNGKTENFNLEAGRAYFLNIGYPHSVINQSSEPRIALMFSLENTDDITDLQL